MHKNVQKQTKSVVSLNYQSNIFENCYFIVIKKLLFKSIRVLRTASLLWFLYLWFYILF